MFYHFTPFFSQLHSDLLKKRFVLRRFKNQIGPAKPKPRPVDDTSIPFGEIREVTGAMDLRKKVKIGTLDDDG